MSLASFFIIFALFHFVIATPIKKSSSSKRAFNYLVHHLYSTSDCSGDPIYSDYAAINTCIPISKTISTSTYRSEIITNAFYDSAIDTASYYRIYFTSGDCSGEGKLLSVTPTTSQMACDGAEKLKHEYLDAAPTFRAGWTTIR
jgi:hypothetical protein